jgi:hypothetical protein
MEEFEKRIEKLEYQISLLISTVDSEKYPVESMILYLNWNDKDLNKAHDIFEKYDNKLENKEENINWTAFENELQKTFDIGYQTVKTIITSFYKNRQWSAVCYYYAKNHECMEFHSLIRDFEQHI